MGGLMMGGGGAGWWTVMLSSTHACQGLDKGGAHNLRMVMEHTWMDLRLLNRLQGNADDHPCKGQVGNLASPHPLGAGGAAPLHLS